MTAFSRPSRTRLPSLPTNGSTNQTRTIDQAATIGASAIDIEAAHTRTEVAVEAGTRVTEVHLHPAEAGVTATGKGTGTGTGTETETEIEIETVTEIGTGIVIEEMEAETAEAGIGQEILTGPWTTLRMGRETSAMQTCKQIMMMRRRCMRARMDTERIFHL